MSQILGGFGDSKESLVQEALRLKELATEDDFSEHGVWAFGVDGCLAHAYRYAGEKSKALDLLEPTLLTYSPIPNEPTHWQERILLDLYAETDQLDRAIKFMDEAITFRKQKLFWYHPENGLVKFRFARFLVASNYQLPLAERYLREAKEHLSGRPLLPQTHLDEIDRLLTEITSR